MIDAELVTRKMLLITHDLQRLRPVADKDLAAYLASDTDELVAERCLERIIGRMIDINYHLLTAAGHPPPPDYHQSFTELATIGVLDHTFALRLAACAGLRNRITHEYADLDPQKVHEALGAALDDIPIYLERIDGYLVRES